VRDLDIKDAHVEFGSKRRDSCQSTLLISDRDPKFGEIGGMRESSRQGHSGGAGSFQNRKERSPVIVGDKRSHFLQSFYEGVELGDDRVAIFDADIWPDGRRTSRDSGHIPKPTGCESEQTSMLGRR
jgi:hypothetical protein